MPTLHVEFIMSVPPLAGDVIEVVALCMGAWLTLYSNSETNLLLHGLHQDPHHDVQFFLPGWQFHNFRLVYLLPTC